MSTTVRQIYDDRIDVAAPGDAVSSTYRFGPMLPKACVHPLLTPRGHQLSGFEPSDHVWHRGLWFTIKYLNRTNFWEEQEPSGRHENVAQPTVELLADSTVRITHDVNWTSEPTGLALVEKRVLTFRSHDDGTRGIDWQTSLTAKQDLQLDRTPYTTWGGYGGLAWRASRELHDVTFATSSGDTTDSIAGKPHDWVVASAKVDGGPDQRVALGMIDHPGNPRSAVPWYCKTGGGFTFMNAAFLFHEPMDLAEGESLAFNYRVLYRDGTWSADEFGEHAKAFRGEAVVQ